MNVYRVETAFAATYVTATSKAGASRAVGGTKRTKRVISCVGVVEKTPEGDRWVDFEGKPLNMSGKS